MPMYEYDCPRCGHFELSQRITEPPLTRHTCGEPVRRQISLTSFALKGGGWYADGYGTKKSSSANGS